MRYVRALLRTVGMLIIMAAAAVVVTAASLELLRRIPRPTPA